MKTFKFTMINRLLPGVLAAAMALTPAVSAAGNAILTGGNTAVLQEAGTLPELFPDEASGAYIHTVSDAAPNSTYLVYVLAGTYTPEEPPVFDGSNVIYYNQVSADANGEILLSMLPSRYIDGSVYLAAGDLTAPKLIGYVKAGAALDVADFNIIPEQDTYTVYGDSRQTTVYYSIQAVDSFGFETELPSYATRAFVDYEGNKMQFHNSADAIILNSTLEEGTYTFSITCGAIERQASFTVVHNPSEVRSLTMTVNGQEYEENYYFDAVADVDGTAFEPDSFEITLATIDQYGNEMPDTYSYIYQEYNEDGTPGIEIPLDETGSVYRFTPPEVPEIGDLFRYTFSAQSHSDPSLILKTDFYVRGTTIYEDVASKQLFLRYLDAMALSQKLEREEIVISSESSSVPSNKQWTTAAIAGALQAAITETSALLTLHKQTPQEGSVLYGQFETLDEAIATFENSLRVGTFAMIEAIRFENERMKIAIGKIVSIPAITTPSRPSERLTYVSDNPAIATVEQNGRIETLTPGVVHITAQNTDGSITATYELTVYTPISSISFNDKSLTLVAGAYASPAYTAKPADHGDNVSFSSSDKEVIRIDGDRIYAVAAGTATVTATTLNGRKDTIEVKVIKPAFSATGAIRAKPTSRVSLQLSVKNAYMFSSLESLVTFDSDIFTFVESKPAGAFADAFVETAATGDGSLRTVWNFDTPTKNISVDDFITYVFDVKDTASYGDKFVRFALTAKTFSGDTVDADNFMPYSTVTVGQTDTYKVTVSAGTGGTVSGGGNYVYGQKVTVTATPNERYTFSGWFANKTMVYSAKTYTFEVTEDITLKALFEKDSISGVESSPNKNPGFGGGGNIQLEKVKPVTSNVPIGDIPAGTKVTLSCATSGAVIYYTLDGTTPNAGAARYTEPIEINQTLNLRAIAIKNGMTNSEHATFPYRVLVEEVLPDVPKPVVSENAKITFKPEVHSIKYVSSGSYLRPNDPASRYEIIEMLSQLFDITGVIPVGTFPDLSPTYKEIVDLYAGAGIINGYEDGTFGGHREITRAEFVKILSIMLGLDKITVPGEDTVYLTDIDGHWANAHIRKFVAKGYILGYPEGDFRPDKSVTRAEAITILNRIIGKQNVSGLPQRFHDVPSDFWAFDDIMNAVK